MREAVELQKDDVASKAEPKHEARAHADGRAHADARTHARAHARTERNLTQHSARAACRAFLVRVPRAPPSCFDLLSLV
jgi:hypothetical protein